MDERRIPVVEEDVIKQLEQYGEFGGAEVEVAMERWGKYRASLVSMGNMDAVNHYDSRINELTKNGGRE
tara:strand:- start:441 stop:647 length:207 start_codon:yes stop_codon:yes gene_type:complete